MTAILPSKPGDHWLDREVVRRVLSGLKPGRELSRRERDAVVYEMIANRVSQREISQRIGVSGNTLMKVIKSMAKSDTPPHMGAHVIVDMPPEKTFMGTVLPPPIGERAREGYVFVQPDREGGMLLPWPIESISVVI